MIENLVYLASLVLVILFLEKLNFFFSFRKNIKYLIKLKLVLSDRQLTDYKKSRIVIIISKGLLVESLFQFFIFFVIILFYVTLIFFLPYTKEIILSFQGLIEAIIIYLIYLKIKEK